MNSPSCCSATPAHIYLTPWSWRRQETETYGELTTTIDYLPGFWDTKRWRCTCTHTYISTCKFTCTCVHHNMKCYQHAHRSVFLHNYGEPLEQGLTWRLFSRTSSTLRVWLQRSMEPRCWPSSGPRWLAPSHNSRRFSLNFIAATGRHGERKFIDKLHTRHIHVTVHFASHTHDKIHVITSSINLWIHTCHTHTHTRV